VDLSRGDEGASLRPGGGWTLNNGISRLHRMRVSSPLLDSVDEAEPQKPPSPGRRARSGAVMPLPKLIYVPLKYPKHGKGRRSSLQDSLQPDGGLPVQDAGAYSSPTLNTPSAGNDSPPVAHMPKI
jgi:hypothetical protein